MVAAGTVAVDRAAVVTEAAVMAAAMAEVEKAAEVRWVGKKAVVMEAARAAVVLAVTGRQRTMLAPP